METWAFILVFATYLSGFVPAQTPPAVAMLEIRTSSKELCEEARLAFAQGPPFRDTKCARLSGAPVAAGRSIESRVLDLERLITNCRMWPQPQTGLNCLTGP